MGKHAKPNLKLKAVWHGKTKHGKTRHGQTLAGNPMTATTHTTHVRSRLTRGAIETVAGGRTCLPIIISMSRDVPPKEEI